MTPRNQTEERSLQLILQFKQLERSLKKSGLQRDSKTCDLCDTGAMLYQLSYEVAHGERGQFVEFISPVRSEMRTSHYI